MLINLVKKELLDNLLSFRFVVSSIIVVLIMLLSTGIMVQDYVNKKDAFIQNETAHRKHAESLDNYMELMFTGIGADRPPSELQFFYTGVEKNPNRSTQIFPFFKPSFMGELNINPVFPLFPAVDLLFVVCIVLSLLAFVYSYDAVCGERENGTLKLLMSYSIPRDKVILAKWIGGYVALIIPYILGIFIMCLLVIINPRVQMSGVGWGAFFMTVIVSLLFIGVMYSIGLFVSVKSKLSSTSISVLLFIWVIFVLIIPNAVPFLVDQLRPISSPSQVMSRIKYKSGDTLNTMIDETIKTFEDATGFSLEQIDFGKRETQETQQNTAQSNKQESSSQQQASSSTSSSGGDEESSSSKKQQLPSGVNMDQLEKIAGGITDNDLRDLQISGCENWISKKLKSQLGITLDQAKKMAKDMGVNVDVNALLKQCEEKKNELIELKRSGKSAEEIASSEGTSPAAAAPVQQQPVVQEKKIKPQQVFSKFMSLSEKEKGQFYDRMYSTFINSFKRNSEISKEEEERYERAVDSQITLTKYLSRISPVSAYVYAVTDLADTGIEHEKHLKKYLWDYQSQFLDFLTVKFNMPDSERVHSIFSGSFREPPYDLSDMPRFDYKSMSLSKRILLALPDMVVLFVFVVVFFLAAFFAFIKAEIID